ncbi:MAG: hypothetical protein LBT24_01550 [Tannerella sp.]|jgi:hypothetical protein|nr:hypothetical protein [Tannerella sp.]
MKGILFKEPLFHKVISGEKKQTRRMVNPQPDENGLWNDDKFPRSIDSNLTGFNGTVADTGESMEFKSRYKAGDTVFLKEPYRLINDRAGIIEVELGYSGRTMEADVLEYKSDIDAVKWINKRYEEQKKSKTGYCNKMFMPEFLALNFIKITDIRCERLQYISDDDCFKEGIFCFGDKFVYDHPNGDSRMIYDTPKQAYAYLIDSISGKGTWESNPFVFVYDFELELVK